MFENFTWESVRGGILEYAPRLLLAIAVLVIGLWIINWIERMVLKAMKRSSIDKDLRPFLGNIVEIGLKVMLLFSVAGMVGIETASFVAVLAAAGFAVGFALQGSLSNFAAGVMILIFKPYRSGDLIEVHDEVGEVMEVQIFNTIMKTLDHHMVIMPNSAAIADKIRNYTTLGYRRVDLNVHIPYEESFPKVQQIILKAVKETPKVLDSPEPMVGIESYDSHNVILAVRPYAKGEDYWDVYFDVYASVKKAMHEADIKVAYSEGVELGPIGS